MKQEQKIEKIRAKCQEILELGKLRTQGRWVNEWPDRYGGILAPDLNIPDHVMLFKNSYLDSADASFIAACAGPAEAMARSTLVALDAFELYTQHSCDAWCRTGMPESAQQDIAAILESWPDEIL